MGNLASGHFKPTNKIQAEHNDRTLSPSYLIPQEFRGQNEVNHPSTQAIELKERIIENAISIYEQTKKKNAPKFKATSYQWSLVVNIKTNTTMSDLEKLAEHFDLKYGFQCYQIAIHRDEGYMDENNQPHTNHHAHMEFITLNKENGKNMMRKAYLSPKNFREIQTEIAQILGMERGTDKRVSGTERIEPRKYAQMKNKERKELETKDKEIATALDTANTDFKKKIPTLQEAVRRIHGQAEILSAIYHFLHQTSLDYVSKLAEKYKHEEVFTKTFGIVKKLKELYSKIVGKLFGDENAKKDYQDILNAISELQERPTKQQLETLKQERTDLTNKLQEQATETKKAQDRIKTLENSKKWLENDLEALESNIKCRARINQGKNKEINTLKDKLQEQEKTINELTKKLQELEDNYRLERERMVAENKRLKEQGLEKTYTQKDYEDLKKAHHQEVEELKKQIQEYKTQETYTPTKRM